MYNTAVHGVTANQDLAPGLLSRDTRSLRQKFGSFSEGPGSGVIAICIGLAIMIASWVGFAAIADLGIVIGPLFWLYARGKRRAVRYRRPMQKGRGGKIEGDGLMYFGNPIAESGEVWFNNNDLRTHMLVFGSTGSGKTRFLLGLLYQALICGSGAMYVDGKGDNTVWWLVYSLCRRLGREDDLLVINYLIGGETSVKKGSVHTKISNTNNPFAHGSGEQLRSLLVGLMRESGGDGDMWKGMASAMMGGLLKCLTHLRDCGEINLDVAKIREYLPLDQIVKLSMRPDLPSNALSPVKKYLAELPGYVEEEAILGRVNPKVYEQHGYRIMQFSEVLSDLEDTYGHIFGAPLGEVDFKDVVFNRRILFVMLPALEKDPDALAGLGKMVVAGVRAALAPALGNKAEGLKSEVIDQKPTNSSVPFVMFLDEYGYYSVKGFAVVAAQARSLGVSVVFAGQDYPSFKKGSEEEAQATIANTNIKIAMKIEEEETAEIMIRRGGKARVSLSGGAELSAGAISSYRDSGDVRFDERSRIDLRDLVRQKPGQAHIIFGDELSRCDLFYADPYEVREGYLNKFIMVEFPQRSTLESISGAFDRLQALFDENPERAARDGVGTAMDAGVVRIIQDYKAARDNGSDPQMACVVAIGMIEWRANHKDEQLIEESRAEPMPSRQAARTEASPAAPEPGRPGAQSANRPVALNEEAKASWDDVSDFMSASASKDPNGAGGATYAQDIFDEPDELLETLADDRIEQGSVAKQARAYSAEFELALTQTVAQTIEATLAHPMSATMKEAIEPRSVLAQIQKNRGDADAQAEDEADRAMAFLTSGAQYPSEPTPKRAEPATIESRINDLLNSLNKSKAGA